MLGHISWKGRQSGSSAINSEQIANRTYSMADILVVGITVIIKNFCSILPSHNQLTHSFLAQEKREHGTDGRRFLPSKPDQ